MTLPRHIDFSEAYSFAVEVVDTVKNPTEVEFLMDFFDPPKQDFLTKALKPNKSTLLHDFIYNLNIFYLDDSTGRYPDCCINGYKAILSSAGINIPKWIDNENLQSKDIAKLDKLLQKASISITEATFHILFSDKSFLLDFQYLLAKKLNTLICNEFYNAHHKKNILPRPNNLPSWLKKAIKARDKNRCQICNSDLSGEFIEHKTFHIDHMLPLSMSGTNDPTNFQLLCSDCNLEKGNKYIEQKFFTKTYW